MEGQLQGGWCAPCINTFTFTFTTPSLKVHEEVMSAPARTHKCKLVNTTVQISFPGMEAEVGVLVALSSFRSTFQGGREPSWLSRAATSARDEMPGPVPPWCGLRALLGGQEDDHDDVEDVAHRVGGEDGEAGGGLGGAPGLRL